jgi:hypothetical protein
MPAALLALIPAFVPVLADGVRAVFSRITGGAGANPANVQEAIQLMAAETDRLKAIAELDRPTGEISRWVADLRAAFRYVAAGLIILGGVVGTLCVVFLSVPEPIREFVRAYNEGMMMPVFSFLFGQRMWVAMGRGK